MLPLLPRFALTGEEKAAILTGDDWSASRTPRWKKAEPGAHRRGRRWLSRAGAALDLRCARRVAHRGHSSHLHAARMNPERLASLQKHDGVLRAKTMVLMFPGQIKNLDGIPSRIIERAAAFPLLAGPFSEQKNFFELLISASGVGPALALRILSGMSVEELVPAIRGGDLVRLTKIPGVGRKTAERIVVELKDRLGAVAIEAEKPAAASPAGIEADVVSALVNLGYDTRAAEDAAAEGKREAGANNFETLLRAALQTLSAPKGRAARTA